MKILLLIVLNLVCFLSSAAFALPGSLDRSFNFPNGYSLFNNSANRSDKGVEVAVQVVSSLGVKAEA